MKYDGAHFVPRNNFLLIMITVLSINSVEGVKSHNINAYLNTQWYCKCKKEYNSPFKTTWKDSMNISNTNNDYCMRSKVVCAAPVQYLTKRQIALRKEKIKKMILQDKNKRLINDLFRTLPVSDILASKPKSTVRKVKKIVEQKAEERKFVLTKRKIKAEQSEAQIDDDEEPTHINHVKVGQYVCYKGEVFVITLVRHIAQARTKGHFKVRMKSLISPKESSYTFPDGMKLTVIKARKINCKYKSYNPAAGYVFMYDDGEIVIPKTTNITSVRYLKPDLAVSISKWKDNIISLYVPFHIAYTVVHVNPGNSAATLDNGLVVPVPTYVKAGDVIEVNTNKCEFLRRTTIL